MSNYIVKELYQDLDRFVSWEEILKRDIKETECISDLHCLYERSRNIRYYFSKQANILIERNLRLKYVFLSGLNGKKLLLKTDNWNIRCNIISEFEYMYSNPTNEFNTFDNQYDGMEMVAHLKCSIINLGIKRKRYLRLFTNSILVSTSMLSEVVNEIHIKTGKVWRRIYPMPK